MDYKGEQFLDKLYQDLHMSEIVEHTASKSDNKEEKIKKYMDRLEKTHTNTRHLDYLKKLYYEKYVIKESDIKDSYYEYLDRQYFDQYGIHMDETLKQEHIKNIIEDQKKSLDIWLEYLTSEDSKFYPTWAKYWVFQGMLRIGAYNNKEGIYGRRTKSTTNPFVELDQEALAKCVDAVIKYVDEEKITDDQLKELIENGNFTKLYTTLIEQKKEKTKENTSTEGIWIKYEQGNNYKELHNSLQGYNTGWCTAGENTCKSQVENGDFYVYYTKDENREFKVPRLAIRMDGKNRIGEIRGVANSQNVEQHLEEVLDKKLDEFPDKENYKQRINDSKILTYIYTKYEYKKELTKEDLRFLYEIDRKIQGFGYGEDPRIEEIKKDRNIINDLNIIFEGVEYHRGGLNLSNLRSAEGLKLPEHIGGGLYLSNLRSAEGLKLPEHIGRDLYLSNLTSAEGLKLPEHIGGSLDLNDGVKFIGKRR